jgi:RNA polymerase sigma factor (TIGR02999 family)
MPAAASSDTSRLVELWSEGEPGALARLVPRLYGELRQLAGAHLRRERADHTLETAALVHEAYLRLVGQRSVACRHRAEFFAIAANTMRRVLVDAARARRCAKRGPGAARVRIEADLPAAVGPDPDLLALDEALERLGSVSPEQARVVELRVFAGLSAEEISTALGVSVPTVTRRWRAARAWLFRLLATGRSHG